MPNPRPRKYPKVSTENLIRSSRDDFGVPTPLNQAIGRRFSEQEQADRKAADMKMSPLDRLKARLEAGAVIGSGIFESVQQLPKLLQGEDSYNEAIAKRMYEPRSNPEKSYEYVGDVADFLEKLETEYKIPQLLPQLMAYQPLMSTANQQVKKAVDRGATKAGMAVERALEKPVTDIMNRGGVGADLLGSFNTDPSRIVKSSGGNWLTGKASNSFEDRLKKMTPYLDQKSAIETQKAKIASMENSGTSSQRTLANVKANLKELEAEQAVNNWVTKNIGNYIKKEMATPEDPVRLMFEKRAQEIEAQFQVDMNRAERTRARAEAEEDPRRKANLTRQAGREEEQAKFDRDFANEYATHLPKDEYGPDEGALDDLRERRVEEGFPAEGIAKSEPAKKWEELADDAIFVRRAQDLQKQKDAYDAYRSTELEYLNMSDQIKKEYAAIITKKIQDTGAQFSDKQLQNIIDNMPLDDKAKAVGEEIEFRRLQNNYFDAKNKSSSGLLAMAEENPWVEKLAPTEKLYSGRIGGLELDHVIDVIKQDVAAGRIRPDQLNKLSMDQAIKRTADFNMEQAKKMRETAIKNMEGFPTYKDYGDEGYKWIELKRPEDLTELPQTHQLEPYESKVHGGTAYRVVNKETGMKGEGFKTPERATQEFLKEHSEERLAEALKYEGDTMGHCVGGYCPDVVSGKSRIYSLRDSRGEPHVTIEVNPNQHLDYNDWFKKQPEEIQNRIAQRRLEDKDHNIYEGPEYLAAREALPPKIRQIKGKQNARPIEKYDPYTQDFVRSGEWSDVGDLKNTGLIKQDGKYMTQAEYDDYLLNELKPPPEPPVDGMKRGGAVHISNNPDTMAIELAGGGLVKKVAKAVAKAVKGTQDVLPAVERDANLEKFLSTSQEKRRLYHATPADFKEFQGKGFDPTISGNATWLTPNKERQPAAHNTSSRTNVYREGVNVMPVYIKAERPLVLDDQIMEDWAKAVYANDSPEFPFLIAPDSLKKIKEDGYDSIFHPRSGEVIMLEPNKIKSAIGNRGTYDIEDPDITKAKGGAIRMSDNSDAMRMELDNKKFAMGGAVGENDVGSPSPQNSASPVPSFQVGGVVKKEAAKAARVAALRQSGLSVAEAKARVELAEQAAEMKQALKASEALAKIEGKHLNITQADRTKVGGGYLGGPGFSGLQMKEGPHKDVGAVWGVKNTGTAKTMLGGFDKPLGKEYFTTMIGSPTQHQSNQMVFDKLYKDFTAQAKKGNLDPELRQKINDRLASAVDKDGKAIFPSNIDILSKNFKKQASTFDQRAVAGNVLGGVGIGGKKGQIFDYEKVIRDTTDPFLLDTPSGDLGYRIWTPSGEVIERPDLHPAFPAIATGEDLGVEFAPADKNILLAPFLEKFRMEKGRDPGYMDMTRGRPARVQITEPLLKNLEESGNKAGGAVKAKNKYRDGGAVSALMKHAETAGQSARMNNQRM